MTKWHNSLAAALFVWALVVAPAIHRLPGHAGESCATCSHEPHDTPADGHSESPPPAPHDAAHCAICQMAAMPMLAFVSPAIAVPNLVLLPIPEIFFDAPEVPSARRLPFACGPPA
jgi:hypothetical protein